MMSALVLPSDYILWHDVAIRRKCLFTNWPFRTYSFYIYIEFYLNYEEEYHCYVEIRKKIGGLGHPENILISRSLGHLNKAPAFSDASFSKPASSMTFSKFSGGSTMMPGGNDSRVFPAPFVGPPTFLEKHKILNRHDT